MVSFVIDCVFPSHPRLEMRDVALEVRQLFYPHLVSHLVADALLREAVFFLVMVFAAWIIPPFLKVGTLSLIKLGFAALSFLNLF